MTTELHKGPLEASSTIDAPANRSWRDKREQRRRRRVWFEELLGWILVPVIVIGCYWLVNLVLAVLGTSPAAIMEGIETILSQF